MERCWIAINDTHYYNDSYYWHTQSDCLLRTPEFEKKKADWNSEYSNILNNCLSKSPKKFHSPAGSNVWNVWVHFQGYVLAFNTYRSQSNMTDRTGGEKCKGTQAICWKWEVSRESQPIIIAKSRWPKKKKKRFMTGLWTGNLVEGKRQLHWFL